MDADSVIRLSVNFALLPFSTVTGLKLITNKVGADESCLTSVICLAPHFAHTWPGSDRGSREYERQSLIVG